MNNVRTGVRSVWKRSWTFLGVILQRFGSERVIGVFARVSSNKYGVGDILERERLELSVGWVQ